MSTKIINVLKSDTFEEVFELFKTADAEEVIFIFPKGSRFTKHGQYFEAISLEAERTGKHVSVMSTDPAITRFASDNELEVLTSPPTTKRVTELASTFGQTPKEGYSDEDFQKDVRKENVGEDFEVTPTIPDEPEENQEQEASLSYDDELTANGGGEIILTVAGASKPDHRTTVKDILPTEYERALRVKGAREKNTPVETKSQPPRVSPKTGEIGRIWAEREKIYRMAEKSRPQGTGWGRILKKSPLLLSGVAFVVLFLILYLTLGNAKITLHPQKQELNFQLKVAASTSESSANVELGRIPGQRFNEQKKESGTFPITGQKEVTQKANGKINIFNSSASEQRLVATTRFRSPDGQIFRIPKTLTVPAAKKVGTETTPGSIESIVYADRPGAEYNIGPTRFTIPGFEGSPKFNEFYATSAKPMTGGLIGPAKVITEEDFAKANESLSKKLRENIINSLKDRAPDLKIIDSISISEEPPIANAKVGEAANNLQITVHGSAEVIAFRESDVVEIVKNYVERKGGVVLITKELGLEYTDPELGSDKKSLLFTAKVRGSAAAKLDKDKILKDVAGMSEDAIRVYFKNIKEVESAKIILSPFWVKSIPKDAGKVELVIEN